MQVFFLFFCIMYLRELLGSMDQGQESSLCGLGSSLALKVRFHTQISMVEGLKPFGARGITKRQAITTCNDA